MSPGHFYLGVDGPSGSDSCHTYCIEVSRHRGGLVLRPREEYRTTLQIYSAGSGPVDQLEKQNQPSTLWLCKNTRPRGKDLRSYRYVSE